MRKKHLILLSILALPFVKQTAVVAAADRYGYDDRANSGEAKVRRVAEQIMQQNPSLQWRSGDPRETICAVLRDLKSVKTIVRLLAEERPSDVYNELSEVMGGISPHDASYMRAVKKVPSAEMRMYLNTSTKAKASCETYSEELNFGDPYVRRVGVFYGSEPAA